MHRHARLSLAGLAGAALLALAVGSASAARLSVTSSGFRIVWRSLSFRSTVAPEVVLECPVTLEGSFHSATFRKVRGAVIGGVTRAQANSGSCTRGRLALNQETLP